MSNPLEDSVLSLDTRIRDEDESVEHYDPPPYLQQAANMPPVDPFSERRSITFITSLNGSLTGPRDFVYYDTTIKTNMPALATNSLRLCTEPNDLPPGTDTLTYPGYHQQIASVSGLHASFIEDRSPLLAAAFEDSRSGRRLHLETLSSDTVMPFLRFLYTGSYAAFGDWQDVPTSVLLHCRMYWLGDLYDLAELKSQAYLNVLRQFEFGCSSPEKSIDLCSAIDFVYKTLAGHDAISDAIVQYCVTQCLSHKLHEDSEFKGLAFNVRAFHQDLTRVCRDRGYEDESSAIIIRLPYKQFAPDTYASMENPPIAGFHDIIHHFHSSDRFDEDSTSKPRKKLTLHKEQASPSKVPQMLGVSKQPASVASRTFADDASPPKPASALPIRQPNTFSQTSTFASSNQEVPVCTGTKLALRQLDDGLARLSTAPPAPGSGLIRRRVDARIAPKPDLGEVPSADAQEGGHLFSGDKSLASARFRERRLRNEHNWNGDAGRSNTADAIQRRHSRGLLEVRPAQYKYKELPTWKPQTLDDAPESTENPFADYAFPEASPPGFQTASNEKQPRVSSVTEHANEIKRRRVDGQDRKDFDPSYPWQRPAFTQLQSRNAAAPSSSRPSWGQSNEKLRAVDLQTANVTNAARFMPSNVSPTLPPTVFGPAQPSTSPPMTCFGPKIAADNTLAPTGAAYNCQIGRAPSSSQTHLTPETRNMVNKMNPAMSITTPAASATPSSVPAHPNAGNHALQDYQMQLMLLEQQNKKRLLMARQGQDQPSWHATPPTAPPASDHDKNALTGITVTTEVITEGHARAPDVLDDFDFDAFLKTDEHPASLALPVSNHDGNVLTGTTAPTNSAATGPGREFDVLDGFDFDAFLKTEEYPASSAEHLEDVRDASGRVDQHGRGSLQQQHQMATALQDAYSMLCIERGRDPGYRIGMNADPALTVRNLDSCMKSQGVPVAQPSTISPVTTRKRYGVQAPNLKRALTDIRLSNGPLLDGPLSQSSKEAPKPTAESSYPGDAGPSADATLRPAQAIPEPDIDMCDSDSDSVMSWVDVPLAKPKSTDNTDSPQATSSAQITGSNPVRAGAKRRSTSSDSEWDFC
jgi:hypothetical protein